MGSLEDWAGPHEVLGRYITEQSERALGAYLAQPDLVIEHANLEQDTAQGGYQHRQLFELVQNSADALSSASAASGEPAGALSAHAGAGDVGVDGAADGGVSPARGGGRIEVWLVDDCLYCADDGSPIDEDGVKALMLSHMSPKRSTSQIGTFGLGFKSLLGVSDAPEFLSRSGSFRFDSNRSCERIGEVVGDMPRYPVLRLADPVDPAGCLDDVVGRELMGWASNIIRLPLKAGSYNDLHQQMREFPAEFLLFVNHVHGLRLTDDSPVLNRVLSLTQRNDVWHLHADGTESSWKLFSRRLSLSPEAAADRRHGESQDEARLWWAAPLERLDQPGKFWAFFPTETASLAAGILNAAWKTNEDRQNLLPGPYNDELIDAAAELIADALPRLATEADPARHLDALPRRSASGDSRQAVLLRESLLAAVSESAVLPDQDGTLRNRHEISYAPSKLASAPRQIAEILDMWASQEARPVDWIHHRALTPNRMARVNRLFASDHRGVGFPDPAAPRAPVGRWLEALVARSRSTGAVQASTTAVRIAALLDRTNREPDDLGKILLTASNAWTLPDPRRVFLPDGNPTAGSIIDPSFCVHPELAADRDTLQALRKLGFTEQTQESRFRMLTERVLHNDSPAADDDLSALWIASRGLAVREARDMIKQYGTDRHRNEFLGLRVRTRSRAWMPTSWVLLPGSIVPGDGSRDDNATVDMGFHGPDRELLTALGVVAEPQNRQDLSNQLNSQCLGSYRGYCEQQYRDDLLKRPEHGMPKHPKSGMLDFTKSDGAGPCQVLRFLSDEGSALYTDALLRMDACYEPLVMWHTGTNQEQYPKEQFDSLAVNLIREHGRISTAEGIVPFADALGENPANTDALLWLLRHPRADRIRTVFKLADPEPEFFGEHDPVPLIDVWPGLTGHLRGREEAWRLVRCERIRVGHDDRPCVIEGNDVYLAASPEEDNLEGLRLVVRALHLNLTDAGIRDIALGTTPAEVEERRAKVRQHTTDAARLLAAVGEFALRVDLPRSLLDALEGDGETLTGVEVAEAAIATHHTDALRQFRHRLDLLKPPAKWAGSSRAVDFVRSLGFSEEWAGERRMRRSPFVDVDGPWEIPDLHDYQRHVVGNVRRLLRAERWAPEVRRGMIGMPTGSGKTRVAVQSIVEAIRDDGFRGGVLWIADRDELCEQAVEAWRQVWASIGSRATRLRISRMWGSQRPPLPVREFHVVVATIQTAHSRLSSPGVAYDFLRGFRLVVFDEAHRSIARTSTTVLRELGLTYRPDEDEPFLLGLTATPYRGHDQSETERLVRRYGSNRLDAGAFDNDDPQAVIDELQRTEVLAQADHELIDGGTFELSTDELSMMQRFAGGPAESTRSQLRAWLPTTAEDRIARDAERTRRIVDAYDTHIEPDWPTLIFATSVEHAQTVSALLNRKGIKARAVSGQTEPATRRRVVEQFRSGDINALVNYAVFREGFDAPRTRAIIVARPVYSPNLYFQMVGRGLRGPKNGGNNRCLILNVRDNIENFSRTLAFSELDWLWAN